MHVWPRNNSEMDFEPLFFIVVNIKFIKYSTVLVRIYDLFYHFDTSNWSLFTQFGYLQKCYLLAFWADS